MQQTISTARYRSGSCDSSSSSRASPSRRLGSGPSARSGRAATASVAARVGFSKRASYCAAKGGILGLTRCLAVEWAPHGVRVNAVAPGHTRTQLVDHAIESGVLPPERLEARIGRIPMGRMAAPAEIAAGIVFLGSPKASYITGETLYIDGAFSVNADELPVEA